MRLSRAAWQAFATAWLVALLAPACDGSSHPDAPGESGGGSGKAGSGSAADGPDLGALGGDGSGTNSPGDVDEECAGELIEAQRIPLDMYVMLDVSGSMLAPTEGDVAVTKWQAVSSALADFVSDDASAGIGMGLQVFPIRHPEAPASCTSSAECGAFGPCFRKFCEDQPGIVVCETKQDCGLLGGDCVDFGFCENDENILCWPPGLSCAEDDNGQPLGSCLQPPTSPCLSTADCRPATYQAPAAAIAELPGARAALLASIESATPDPDGATPTGPALEGAIDQARAWAMAHADHQVVAVLATDGLPTECAPVEIDDVAALASAGSLANPSIATFVIGVVGSEDADAPGNLDAIARAGGTEQAFIVDTQGDVAAQFRSALNQIRASRLSCDLLVPKAEAGKPVDYDYVNVVLDDGSGPATLDYVTDASGCSATAGGWYFETEPDGGAAPEHILVCPATCEKFGQVDSGSVQIKLGCARREPK
jgi:Mg-chelatase subunit ChlD